MNTNNNQQANIHYCTRLELDTEIDNKKLNSLLDAAGFVFDETENEYEKLEIRDNAGAGYNMIVQLKGARKIEFSSFNIFSEKGNPFEGFESELVSRIESYVKIIVDSSKITSFDVHGLAVKDFGNRIVRFISNNQKQNSGFIASEISKEYEGTIVGIKAEIEEELELDRDAESGSSLLYLAYTARVKSSQSTKDYIELLKAVVNSDGPLKELGTISLDYLEEVKENA